MVEAAVVHPLDMIKTRHQLNAQRNESIVATARGLIREGGFPRLYRGLLPELLGMMPTRSAMVNFQGRQHRSDRLLLAAAQIVPCLLVGILASATPELSCVASVTSTQVSTQADLFSCATRHFPTGGRRLSQARPQVFLKPSLRPRSRSDACVAIPVCI